MIVVVGNSRMDSKHCTEFNHLLTAYKVVQILNCSEISLATDLTFSTYSSTVVLMVSTVVSTSPFTQETRVLMFRLERKSCTHASVLLMISFASSAMSLARVMESVSRSSTSSVSFVKSHVHCTAVDCTAAPCNQATLLYPSSLNTNNRHSCSWMRERSPLN